MVNASRISCTQDGTCTFILQVFIFHVFILPVFILQVHSGSWCLQTEEAKLLRIVELHCMSAHTSLLSPVIIFDLISALNCKAYSIRKLWYHHGCVDMRLDVL
jgi:hypothetical protein